MSKVLVVGLGYVGLPLAVRAAQVGHEVIGIDRDAKKIAALHSGHTYIEDVTDEVLQDVIACDRFRAEPGWSHPDEAPVAEFDIAVIAVPTPLGSDGVPDLSYIKSAATMLGQVLVSGSTVVLESTTYPGTTDGLLRETLEKESGLAAGLDFHLGFSPERIDPGNRVHTLQTTPKLVSGIDSESLAIIQAFYDTVVDTTVPVPTPAVAETAKLWENIFAQINIAAVNELAIICHDLGINVWDVIDAAMTKGHSMLRWTPGPGVGGHCLPVDPAYLSWLSRSETGRGYRLSELAQEINDSMPRYSALRASRLVGGLSGKKVLVLGVAYKPNTGDLRESPALEVVKELVSAGALVTISDPYVSEWSSTPSVAVHELEAEIGRYDLVMVVTDHDEFPYDAIERCAQRVLDCRAHMRRSDKVEVL